MGDPGGRRRLDGHPGRRAVHSARRSHDRRLLQQRLAPRQRPLPHIQLLLGQLPARAQAVRRTRRARALPRPRLRVGRRTTVMADSASPAPRWGVAPYFLVADVVAAANDYRDRLGFAYERFWGEPPAFCMVYRRGVVIMLKQAETAGASRPNHRAD